MLQVFALSFIQLPWINRWPGEDASYFRCLGEELCKVAFCSSQRLAFYRLEEPVSVICVMLIFG